MASETSSVLPVRVRVNISRTTTGKVSYEATVELVLPLGAPRGAAALLKKMHAVVLEASDNLNADLQRRYPIEGARGV